MDRRAATQLLEKWQLSGDASMRDAYRALAWALAEIDRQEDVINAVRKALSAEKADAN